MKIEDNFHMAMVNIYNAAKRDCGYNATRFLQMISEVGGLKTAKKLIIKENETYGFERLWELKRLDLSVEALVLKKEFIELFSLSEREICKQRLHKYGYKI